MQVRQTRTPLSGLSIRTRTMATGASRQNDADHSRRVQMLDEPGNHPQRCSMSVTGEQRGIGLDGPGQFLLVSALPTRPVDYVGDGVIADAGIDFGDNGVDHRDRVTVIDVRALSASRMPLTVDDLYPFDLTAASTWCPSLFARTAIPVLASAGEGPQGLAAGGAGWR